MRVLMLFLACFISGCTAGAAGSFDADVDVGFGGEGPSGDGDGDSQGVAGGTGGAFLDGVGGTDVSSAGGTDNGTGGALDGTGGDLGGTDRCYPQWDPEEVYEEGARVQVEERIYARCGGGDSEGMEPHHYNNTNPSTCVDTWHWIADCASRRCEDAIEWDSEEMFLQFYPPLTLGALFRFEGEVWELTEWDHEIGEMWNMEFPTYCPPNPEPGEVDEWGNACEDQLNGTFELAPQCL